MKVWLDDVRDPPENWEWAKTAQEAIDFLRTGKVTQISLDHDLGLDGEAPNMENLNQNGTGYDVITWIEYQIHFGLMKNVPNINIHSANPVGVQRMNQVLDRIKTNQGAQGR